MSQFRVTIHKRSLARGRLDLEKIIRIAPRLLRGVLVEGVVGILVGVRLDFGVVDAPIVVRGRPSGEISRESSAERLASSMARVDAEYWSMDPTGNGSCSARPMPPMRRTGEPVRLIAKSGRGARPDWPNEPRMACVAVPGRGLGLARDRGSGL